MATSTIFNFNFNNSEIVDSTGQWYNATTGTPTTEFINHDGNTALFQPARTNGNLITPNPTMLQSYDPNFKAYAYTFEVQVCAVLNRVSNSSFILNFPNDEDSDYNATALGLLYNQDDLLEMWIDHDIDGAPMIRPILIDFNTAGFDRWFSVRIERTVDPNNPYIGATIKAYVDGAEVYNHTFTYAQSTSRGKIGPRLRYCENLVATGGIAIDNLKLTAGIAPSSVVDVSLANLQRNNANLLSFIKGKVPAVNDGTLTIQKNGTNVATFTANASTNATANIQCVDLTSAQTIGGDKEFTGTTTAHDVVPSATDTYNFGSSSAQWNNAYIKALTINGVACGDILTHNASEFVDVSSDQTIGGVKTFAAGGCTFFKQIKINHNLEYDKDNPPSQSAYHNLMFTDASGWWGGFIENVTDTNGNSTLAFYVRNTNEIQSRVYLKCDIDGSFSMYPLSNNVWDLGTSTNKWKSFNGLNPGALSLPSISEGVVTVDNSAFQWGTNWIYTPVFDGWMTVEVPASSATKRRYSVSQESLRYWYPNQNGEIFRFSLPVVKGVSVNFAFISDINEPAAPTIKLLKAQGNV